MVILCNKCQERIQFARLPSGRKCWLCPNCTPKHLLQGLDNRHAAVRTEE